MSVLIKDGEVQPDRWTLVKEARDLGGGGYVDGDGDAPSLLRFVPGKKLILPLRLWKEIGGRSDLSPPTGSAAGCALASPAALSQQKDPQGGSDSRTEHPDNIAVWLNSDEGVGDLGEGLHGLPLVALNFPVFSDGRAYSKARELREIGYKGEVRAIGDVLRDQLFYMSRCGFNAFQLRHDQDPEDCLAAFEDFQTTYTATVTEPVPLFRRR